MNLWDNHFLPSAKVLTLKHSYFRKEREQIAKKPYFEWLSISILLMLTHKEENK